MKVLLLCPNFRGRKNTEYNWVPSPILWLLLTKIFRWNLVFPLPLTHFDIVGNNVASSTLTWLILIYFQIIWDSKKKDVHLHPAVFSNWFQWILQQEKYKVGNSCILARCWEIIVQMFYHIIILNGSGMKTTTNCSRKVREIEPSSYWEAPFWNMLSL